MISLLCADVNSFFFCDQITERNKRLCYTMIKKDVTEVAYEKTL